MAVPAAGPVVHGALLADPEALCEVTGPPLTFVAIHPAQATVDWFAPSRPVDATLPVLTGFLRQDNNMGAEPETGFFGLTQFDVTAWQAEQDPPCSMTCRGEQVTDAYVVMHSVATDAEVAELGLSDDEAKARLIEITEERDRDGQIGIGCNSLGGSPDAADGSG